jgi:hypothetical protein
MEKTGRKLREDLTPEEAKKALEIGRIEFKSARRAWDPEPKKFIPSRERH